MSDSMVTYTAKGIRFQEGRAAFSSIMPMCRELASARELVWRLFLRDFTARYRQSVFGVAWAVITPIVTACVFMGMNRSGVLNIGDVGAPYPVYALIGFSVWSLFSTGLTAASQALVNAGSMVGRINFPRVALVLAATGQALVDLIIRMVLVGLACAWFGVPLSFRGTALSLVCLIPACMLVVGAGFVMSLLTAVLRDTSNALNMALLAAMLLTPVFYPLNSGGSLALLNVWNPLNYLVNAPRDILIAGRTDLMGGFLASSALSAVFLCLGWRIFYLAQAKIAERI